MSPAAEFRRPSWILSALLVGVLIVLAVVMMIVTAASPPEHATSSGAPAPAVDPACLGVIDLTTPTTAPDAEWTVLDGVALPGSAEAGPAMTSDSGVRLCYARTPSGAIFAATNFIGQASASPASALAISEDAVASGLGREAAIEAARAALASSTDSRTSIQIAGFRVLEFSEERARVEVAVSTGAGDLASGVVVLRWEEGDWRLVADPSTGEISVPSPLQSLGGFIPWSAR